MANTSRIAIQETYDLPSRGKFPGVPDKITIRAMSLLDEKKRLASQGINGIIDLIGSCIVSPENLNPYDMPRFDVDFAMLKLRVVSHGPMYNVEVTCPFCGHVNKLTINLDEIPVKSVGDDFEPVIEVGPLPASGDVLKLKMLTFGDIDKIETESKRILAKFPEYEGDPSGILNYIYKIVEVNGKKDIPYPQLKTYVEGMTAADSIYIDEAYSDFLNKYGPDTQIIVNCKNCKEDFMREMPMNAEFFRPKYYTPKR